MKTADYPAVQWISERSQNFLAAITAKMKIPKERSFSPKAYGVYPHTRQLPSPSGTIWLAYVDTVWITTQLAFWTAQAVTDGYSPFFILVGFLSTIIQMGLVFCLVRGIQKFSLNLLLLYMFGMVVRILIFIFFIFMAAIVNNIEWQENDDSFIFFRTIVILKVIFWSSYSLLKSYALYTVFRCYLYMKDTRDFFRMPSSHQCISKSDTMESTCTRPNPNSIMHWTTYERNSNACLKS